MKTDLLSRITVEAGKCGGKPCIRGLRVTVYDVLDYLAAGMTHEQILEEFPYLTEDDIRAYYANLFPLLRRILSRRLRRFRRLAWSPADSFN